MTLEEKYNSWLNLYNKYYINISDSNEDGSNIPISTVNFDNSFGMAGDGTINIAYRLIWAYLNDYQDVIEQSLSAIERLVNNAYKCYAYNYPRTKLKLENGFFLRDDIIEMNNLNKVISCYNSCIIGEEQEDTCQSPYISQDQCWNLLPILGVLSKNNPKAKSLGYEIFKFVVSNKHVIYNPYLSTVVFNNNYLNLNVPYEKRLDDREKHLKYKIKVKRGANNWYFAYGFKKAYNLFGGNSKTFWSSLWYKPFIFIADNIYHKYICKWLKLPIKNTSYYAMGIGADAWYDFSDVNKKIIKKLNKSLKDNTDLFNPEIAVLSTKSNDIDKNMLLKWLEKYPEPKEEGLVESPIIFMILYSFYVKNLNK